MARNGSGTYSLPSGNPVVSGSTISSNWANNTLSDIATALTSSLAKDGQTVPTANIPMGGFKLTGLAAATSNGDALRFEQLPTLASLGAAASGANSDITSLSALTIPFMGYKKYSPVATTSGTSIDPFGGVTIPTWAKRITLTLNAISQATGDFFVVRLGTSGGIVSAGYAAGWSTNGASGNNVTGFEFEGRVDASSSYTGKVVYELHDASTNTWISSGCVYAETGDTFSSAGRVSLSGLLTQMRLTTLTAVTLDGGSISVMVEG
jgi:hypothetical protein